MSGLPGFTAVKDAKHGGTVVNIMGVVVSQQQPRKTRGTDWCLDFTIQDDFSAGSVGGSSSMGCRVFKPSQTTLPQITGPGDIVILRNFKLNAWQGRMDCVSNPSSGVLVFPADKIPVPELSQAYMLGTQRLTCHATHGCREATIPEQKAVLRMKHSSSGSEQDVQQHASLASHNAATKRKEHLIQDLADGMFSDVRAQVLNVYYSNHGTVELKVTDYTPNKDLYRYEDPHRDAELAAWTRGWPGPYGQLTLDIRLYEPHAAWARGHLSKGDFVYLRNVHVRRSRDNFVEGALHEDRRFPDQVDVSIMKDEQVIAEINTRREAYEQQRSNNQGTVHLINAPRKSSAKASVKKKLEKKERQRLQKETELKELEQEEQRWEVDRSGINMNVRAAFTEYQRSTLSEIINNPHLQAETSKYNKFTLPFVNCKHRARVRVVDFYPPEIEYFARCSNDREWTPRSKRDSRWDWGFVLLLEDANVPRDTVPVQLRVIVNNASAQYLGLPDAKDLKANPKMLNQVKEKLWIMWGNLEELKSELRARGADLPLPPGDNRLQNKPFDCCIEEYGHEVPVTEEHPTGYQRLHGLCFTKICS